LSLLDVIVLCCALMLGFWIGYTYGRAKLLKEVITLTEKGEL